MWVRRNRGCWGWNRKSEIRTGPSDTAWQHLKVQTQYATKDLPDQHNVTSEQTRANYGLGTICDPLNFIIRPAKLEEIILILTCFHCFQVISIKR